MTGISQRAYARLRGVNLSAVQKAIATKRITLGADGTILGRFEGRIKHLSIRMADVNGPRGGIEQCCDIRIDAGLRQKVVVRERQATIHAAVAFALERAERSVEPQLSLANLAGRRSANPRTSFQFGD